MRTNSINSHFENLTDGFEFGGGTTLRKFKVSGGDCEFTGIPTATTKLIGNNIGLAGGTTIIGGTGANDRLKLRTTSGVGDGATIDLETGNNGSLLAMRILNNGKIVMGGTSTTHKLEVVDDGGGTETPFKLRVADNVDDFWSVSNASGVAGVFVPTFLMKCDNTLQGAGAKNSPSTFVVQVGNDTDVSQSPAMHFDARNYAGTGQISNRPLFGFGNFFDLKLLITVTGNIGIGDILMASQGSGGLPANRQPVSRVHIWTEATTKIGHIIQGFAGQTANLSEWRNSAGAMLAAVNADGALQFGTHALVGAETVTGYITIKDAGGISRKLAILS